VDILQQEHKYFLLKFWSNDISVLFINVRPCLALSGFENKIEYLRGGNIVGFDSSQVTLVYVFRYSACQVKVQVDH
jgi:hypothetical protein